MTEIEQSELEQQVMFSLLRPIVRFARVLKVPLKEITRILQLVYYRELMADGMNMKEACDHLGISLRTASRLSKQMKTTLFRPEQEHSLPRQIEFMLWVQPLSRARVRQALSEIDPESVDRALDQLIESGRVVENNGRVVTYSVAASSQRLSRRGWLAKIGGLNSLLSAVTDTVYSRFFGEPKRSLARTLLLRVSPDDISRLEEIYETHIWKPLAELDAKADNDRFAIPISLSVCWAPDGALEAGNHDVSTSTAPTPGRPEPREID